MSDRDDGIARLVAVLYRPKWVEGQSAHEPLLDQAQFLAARLYDAGLQAPAS